MTDRRLPKPRTMSIVAAFLTVDDRYQRHLIARDMVVACNRRKRVGRLPDIPTRTSE